MTNQQTYFNEIFNQMIYDYAFIASMNQAKINVGLHDYYIDRTIQVYTHQLLLNILALIKPSRHQADDLFVDLNKLSETDKHFCNTFYNKYKKYRNKKIAHISQDDFQIPQLELQELKHIVDILIIVYKENLSTETTENQYNLNNNIVVMWSNYLKNISQN